MNAAKERYGKGDLRKLFSGSSKVVVAKGKRILSFDPGKELGELSAVALGPTGNLRAPAMRMGKTWLIGFHEEAYTDRFD